jgi:hypothetical protein
MIWVSDLEPPDSFLNLTLRLMSLFGVESFVMDDTRMILANVRQIFNIIENHS